MKNIDDKLLLDLHNLVVKDLIKKVKSGEAKSTDISNAISLLKQNGVVIESGNPDDNDQNKILEGIRKKLQEDIEVVDVFEPKKLTVIKPKDKNKD